MTDLAGPVFLDSGILIAFLDRRDQWHTQAVALFGTGRSPWRTSYLVIAETYTWFLHRQGEESARGFRRMIDDLGKLEVFEVTAHIHRVTVAMLDRLRGAKLSYVDASSLALMEAKRIRVAWSTDHHLGLTGAEILPRV